MPGFTNIEEDLAARFLRLVGFTILSRNTRRYGAELDIICKSAVENEFYIFEVKKHKNRGAVFYPTVSARQLKRLKNSAASMVEAAEKFLNIRICLLIIDVENLAAEMIVDII